MALKDLLVYLDPSARAGTRLRLAVDLAHRHSSRLTALYVREWSPDEVTRDLLAAMKLPLLMSH